MSALSPFARLQLLRTLAGALMLLLVGSLFDLGGHPASLALAGTIGTLLGGALAHRPPRQTLLRGGILLALAIIFPRMVSSIAGSFASQDSLLPILVSDLCTVLAALVVIFAISTYCFWRYASALLFELFALAGVLATLVSGHRNYRLDAPKELSSLAWKLGLESSQLLLGLGVATTIFFGCYLIFATARPLIGSTVIRTPGKSQRVLAFLFPTILILLLIGYARYINSRYEAQLSKANEGVGDRSDEGKSPLGFHSAVGKTKQPAALIRFDGDYAGNPWAPMLYIREGALSTYNGREIVLAEKEYDQETPRIRPGEPYSSSAPTEQSDREKISYAVYLLAKHATALAIDYPLAIRLLKNPDPNRFLATYHTASLAPRIKLEEMIDRAVGDPNWSEEERAHYLRAPGSLEKNPLLPSLEAKVPDSSGEDLRYLALSRQLTEGITNPIERAAQIVQYLSRESIYTRQPGHQVTDDGDPVAPYLFSADKRGYCVHFAHAAVYLLRLAGIPARIGTGYLTDLSFAKDGHILLNMGDRHAWPEIYIEGFGWAVFDVQPAKAENEQIVPPDPKLLEELMSKLDPILESTPFENTTPGETARAIEAKIFETLTDRRLIVTLFVALALLLLGLKAILRFSYLLLPSDREKLLGAYRSLASLMTDLGLPREFGETRSEYLSRLSATGLLEQNELPLLVEEAAFHQSRSVGQQRTSALIGEALMPLRSPKGRAKRMLAFFNPSSLFRWGRW